MNKHLLTDYIRLLVKESNDQQEELDDSLEEFSGVGAIAGYTGPLGMDPDKLGRKKLKQKK